MMSVAVQIVPTSHPGGRSRVPYFPNRFNVW
jgi:hypothetical protein